MKSTAKQLDIEVTRLSEGETLITATFRGYRQLKAEKIVVTVPHRGKPQIKIKGDKFKKCGANILHLYDKYAEGITHG